MEREILFRGKRIDSGEWHYGSLIQNGSELEIYDCNQDILHCGEDVDPETVGQYTGLKDKNGIRIFEGDIYHKRDKNIKCKVVWNDSGLMGKQIGTYGSYEGLTYWINDIEVIGNIHDKQN